MAYKTTIAISANRANGRTAVEGIESCSPVLDYGPRSFGHGRVGVLAPQSSSASRGRWKGRFFGFTAFSWFPRENTATDYQRDHCGQKNPQRHLVQHGALRRPHHCCIRQSGAVTRSFDAVGKCPPKDCPFRANINAMGRLSCTFSRTLSITSRSAFWWHAWFWPVRGLCTKLNNI
jgi:hypothetical protein